MRDTFQRYQNLAFCVGVKFFEFFESRRLTKPHVQNLSFLASNFIFFFVVTLAESLQLFTLVKKYVYFSNFLFYYRIWITRFIIKDIKALIRLFPRILSLPTRTEKEQEQKFHFFNVFCLTWISVNFS